METIHFSEEESDNIAAIGQSLFDIDQSDPRSWNYKRILIRSSIRWHRILLFILALIGGTVGVYFLAVVHKLPSKYALLICVVCNVVVLLLCLKRILICIVCIYQRFAPDSIRNKCRFEPSCSQYMILSLKKYGLWKGLSKGINRLKRCNTNDGGFDYP